MPRLIAARNDSSTMTIAVAGSQGALGTSQERRLEFDALLSRAWPRFLRIAMRSLRNREDAEDAVQDAMLSAFRHIAQFDGRAQFSTWLTAIVINAVRMQIRRRMRRSMVSLDENLPGGKVTASELLVDPQPTPEQTLVQVELRRIVAEMTNRLPSSQRRALELRLRHNLPVKSAAEALGVPQGTVKAQLARGRAELKRRLEKALGVRRKQIMSHDSKEQLEASIYHYQPEHPREAQVPSTVFG